MERLKRFATVITVLAVAGGLAGLPVSSASAGPVPESTGSAVFHGATSTYTFVRVEFHDASGAVAAFAQVTPTAGNFTFPTPAPGVYWVSVSAFGSPNWATTYLGNVPLQSQSVPITVESGTAVALPAVDLYIEGTITGWMATSSGGYSNSDSLDLYLLNSSTNAYELYRTTHPDIHQFAFGSLPAGTYKLRAEAADPQYAPGWYLDATNMADATELVLAAAQTKNVSILLSGGRGWGIERFPGLDRFDTNVRMSQNLFPDVPPEGIPVLYIANGMNYPDALSAGPAASHLDGGLLLVTPAEIPAQVLSEIVRLAPQRIVVVGGTGAVSDSVRSTLESIAPVRRVEGADRYETSRNLVEDAFASAQKVFIATGQNFPDALSAGAAAARFDAPVLLVRGEDSTLDLPTRTALADLGATDSYIAGGTGAVSVGIENSLVSVLTGTVTRFAGSNRYDTSAQINAAMFTSADRIYVANGSGFADALAASPLAAANGSPLFLATRECAPIAIYNQAISLDATEIWLAGGYGVLAEDWDFGGSCGGL
jgi:putative cell wall-binding protein